MIAVGKEICPPLDIEKGKDDIYDEYYCDHYSGGCYRRRGFVSDQSEKKPAGGSCSAAKMKKKKLDGPVIGKKTIEITGMHCEHCAMSVTKALNQIDGVRADVSLSKGRAVISYDREVAEEVLKNTVEKAGYKVLGIS